jgi:hypothetical protein
MVMQLRMRITRISYLRVTLANPSIRAKRTLVLRILQRRVYIVLVSLGWMGWISRSVWRRILRTLMGIPRGMGLVFLRWIVEALPRRGIIIIICFRRTLVVWRSDIQGTGESLLWCLSPGKWLRGRRRRCCIRLHRGGGGVWIVFGVKERGHGIRKKFRE